MSFGTGFGTTGGFGAQQTPAPGTGTVFGTPSAQQAQPTGFSFGTATAQPAAGGGLFGATNATQSNLFGFGNAGQATASAPGFNFNTPVNTVTPAATGFGVQAQPAIPASTGGFGAFGASTTPGFGSLGAGFGAPQVSTTATQPKLGLSFGTPAITTAAAPGFSFGQPVAASAPGALSLTGSFAPAATAPTFGLSFGATPATTSTGLGTGLTLGLGTASTQSGFGASALVPPTTTASIGLGGVATTTPLSTTAATKTELSPKEQLLPNEIQQTVDTFKSFVKQQKSNSSDVARCSVKEFRKVEGDIDDLNSLLSEVEKQLQINRSITEKLKYDTAKGLQQVEMAQRTYDTPIGLQYENTAPLQYFMELSEHFEREMQNMRVQIENTDKYIKDNGKQAPLTHVDLIMGMRRIHEIFVSLAGQLQVLHSQVESQKEQYLNFRKYMLNDSTNVFEATNKETEQTLNQLRTFSLKQPSILASGPTPFGNITHRSVVKAAAQNTAPQAFPPNNPDAGFSYNLGMNLGSNPSTGSMNFGLGTSTPALQLQKPPTGNKRGKQ